MSVRSVSGVAPTTNCIVIPDAPPGRSGSAGRPSRRSACSRRTSLRAVCRLVSAVSRLFSGAICARRLPAGRLQVQRDAAGQRRQPLDLRGLAAGHHLHVHVAAKALAAAQQLQHGDQVVHHLDRPAGDAGGDEQAAAPAAAVRLQEDAHQLLGLEQGARHVAVAPHGAVVAVEAARVGHQDAQQRHLPLPRHPQVADVQRPQRAHVLRMAQPRRQRAVLAARAVVVVARQRDQQVELLVQRHRVHGALRMLRHLFASE